ncbi:hypothetical protein [Aeromonas phage Aer_P220]|uniref:Uncharacterized protein n=1 Tax=Aeromonas phage Aer_P220 TaxID=2951227 RepID=A0A9E7T426_9CAUD|nr:hypothetical protein [Aeromonas phage Aer_P220]
MTRRAIGTSTGQALGFIGSAMQRPNVKLTVPKDHFNNSLILQARLADMIMDNVSKLGLVGFERISSDVIMYSPVGEVDAVVQL